MADTTWTEVKGDTTGRMEFHLGRMYEGIQTLKDVGLDVVAKKLEDAHKMMVKDLNERWSPNEDGGNTVLAVFIKRENGEMSSDDMVKELQKIAKKNSNVGRI
jgi:hypothetical protein